MSPTVIVGLIVFVGVVAGVFALLSAISRRNSRAEERLERMRRPQSLMELDPTREQSLGTDRFQGILDKAIALSKPLMPRSELEQSKLKLSLAHAGFRSEKAVSIFLAIKFSSLLLMVILSLAIFGWRSDVTFPGLTENSLYAKLIWAGVFAAIGLWGPELLLTWLRRKRQQAIFLSLPDALDLRVVCVESGLGLDAAMRKVCEEMKDHAPVICEELTIANFQLQMGRPRREVLHDLGVRTGVDDVRSLAAILIQADRFGSSVAQALRVQSDSMRVRRRQLAEEKAAKTAVQLLFPLVLFIFPAIFIVLVGPAGIQIARTPFG